MYKRQVYTDYPHGYATAGGAFGFSMAMQAIPSAPQLDGMVHDDAPDRTSLVARGLVVAVETPAVRLAAATAYKPPSSAIIVEDNEALQNTECAALQTPGAPVHMGQCDAGEICRLQPLDVRPLRVRRDPAQERTLKMSEVGTMAGLFDTAEECQPDLASGSTLLEMQGEGGLP